MDGSGSAGPSVPHRPCVGVTVAQTLRHALAGAAVHGDRFENTLPPARQRAIRMDWMQREMGMESASKRDRSGGTDRDNG